MEEGGGAIIFFCPGHHTENYAYIHTIKKGCKSKKSAKKKAP
jgi:hypothetical protein